jgi:hypothetical protein
MLDVIYEFNQICRVICNIYDVDLDDSIIYLAVTKAMWTSSSSTTGSPLKSLQIPRI